MDLTATAERFTATGLALTGIIAASEDDWDRYESPHWRAMEEWLATQTMRTTSVPSTSAVAANT